MSRHLVSRPECIEDLQQICAALHELRPHLPDARLLVGFICHATCALAERSGAAAASPPRKVCAAAAGPATTVAAPHKYPAPSTLTDRLLLLVAAASRVPAGPTAGLDEGPSTAGRRSCRTAGGCQRRLQLRAVNLQRCALTHVGATARDAATKRARASRRQAVAVQRRWRRHCAVDGRLLLLQRAAALSLCRLATRAWPPVGGASRPCAVLAAAGASSRRAAATGPIARHQLARPRTWLAGVGRHSRRR